MEASLQLPQARSRSHHSTSRAPDPLDSLTGRSPAVRADRLPSLSSVELLNAELYAFVEATRPSQKAHRARVRAVRCLERIVQVIWPEATIEPFGSLATGLYLPDGDLDVVVSLPAVSHVAHQAIFDDIARAAARSAFADPSSIEILSQARVPILKFNTSPEFGSFALDISLEHARDGPLGAIACLEILRRLDESRSETTRSDRAKGLVLVLKKLLQVKELGSTRDGGIGGMAIFCLVIAFVQHDRRTEEACSPASDLLAFLEFAGNFNYEHDAITVAGSGSILPKSTQRWTDGSKPRRICIQHPTDLSRNLSAGTYKLYELQAAFRDAHTTLTAQICCPVPPASLARSFLAEIFARPHDLEADLDEPFYSRAPSSPSLHPD